MKMNFSNEFLTSLGISILAFERFCGFIEGSVPDNYFEDNLNDFICCFLSVASTDNYNLFLEIGTNDMLGVLSDTDKTFSKSDSCFFAQFCKPKAQNLQKQLAVAAVGARL